MLNMLKRYKALTKTVALLKSELDALREQLKEPSKVVEAIMGKDLTIIDMKGKAYTEKMEYYKDAQEVLKNKTLQNEIRILIDDQVNFIATKAKDTRELRDAQMVILAYALLEERLKDIKEPDRNEDYEDEIYLDS